MFNDKNGYNINYLYQVERTLYYIRTMLSYFDSYPRKMYCLSVVSLQKKKYHNIVGTIKCKPTR